MDALFGMIVLFLIGYGLFGLSKETSRDQVEMKGLLVISIDTMKMENLTKRRFGKSVKMRSRHMELQDFTEKEQEMIKKRLTFSKLSDKETADKIIALIPQEYIKRIPFFVRKHAITRTIKRISLEYPELYAVAEQEGQLPEKEAQELRQILTDIFQEKMNKHKIK